MRSHSLLSVALRSPGDAPSPLTANQDTAPRHVLLCVIIAMRCATSFRSCVAGIVRPKVFVAVVRAS